MANYLTPQEEDKLLKLTSFIGMSKFGAQTLSRPLESDPSLSFSSIPVSPDISVRKPIQVPRYFPDSSPLLTLPPPSVPIDLPTLYGPEETVPRPLLLSQPGSFGTPLTGETLSSIPSGEGYRGATVAAPVRPANRLLTQPVVGPIQLSDEPSMAEQLAMGQRNLAKLDARQGAQSVGDTIIQSIVGLLTGASDPSRLPPDVRASATDDETRYLTSRLPQVLGLLTALLGTAFNKSGVAQAGEAGFLGNSIPDEDLQKRILARGTSEHNKRLAAQLASEDHIRNREFLGQQAEETRNQNKFLRTQAELTRLDAQFNSSSANLLDPKSYLSEVSKSIRYKTLELSIGNPPVTVLQKDIPVLRKAIMQKLQVMFPDFSKHPPSVSEVRDIVTHVFETHPFQGAP